MGDVVHCYVDASCELGDGFSGIYVDACVPVRLPVAWFGYRVDSEAVDLILCSGEMEKSFATRLSRNPWHADKVLVREPHREWACEVDLFP